MRLAAIAKNIKASGVCGVHYVGPLHEVWIMTAHGIYRLNGYPKPIDRDETAMMFGIGPKTMENIAYNDFTDEDATWLEGYNLTDSVEGEIRVCADGYVQHHEQCPRTYDEGLGRSDRRPWPQARPLPGV